MIDPAHPDYDDTPASDLRSSYHYLPRAEGGQPLVSIITPYFNAGSVFQETIRSIQRMSMPYWEWLIVDDGSTDPASLAQLETLARMEPRVRVIHQSNQGPAAARNRGAEAATTAYLVQVDADDLIEPTFVEKALWLLETQPQFDAAGSHNVTFGAEQLLWQNGFQQYETALTKENMMTNLAVIRRSAYLACGGHDESIVTGHEDWDFWMNFAERGSWGYSIPEYLTWYRKSAGSRSYATNDNQVQADTFQRWIMAKHTGLAARFKAPRFPDSIDQEYPDVPDEAPIQNDLAKPQQITRILLIVPWLEIGGSDKFTLDFVRTLSARGYEFTIASTLASTDPWLHEFSQQTPDIFCLHRFLNPLDYPRFLNYLIDSREIDAVMITNSEMGYLLAPYLRAHHPQLAIFDYAHAEEEHWKNGGYPGMAVRIGSQLDLHITSTDYLKRWMVAHGGDAGRIRVAHTNIDARAWTPLEFDIDAVRADLNIGAHTPIILYVGRVVAQKRPMVWAEIVRRLAKLNPNFVALVVGEGNLLPDMRAFVNTHRLQQVRFLGAQPNAQVRKIMATSDILLLPSQYEGLALVLFECMAMEMAPVAVNFAGHPELVTSDCGYLVDFGPDEIDAYVAHLSTLLGDPALRRRMMLKGRERVVTSFALEHMADDMERYISEARVLATQRPSTPADPTVVRDVAARAMHTIRLMRLTESLWNELHNRGSLWAGRALPRPRTPQEAVRYTRERLFPIGSPRYEVYKRWRRTLLPRAHYDDEG